MSRVYVVTGAASGIGAATAGLLAERGHRVIGVDLKDADVAVDLGTDAGRRELVEGVTELSGGVVDGVIAVAGTSVPAPTTVRVNYFGTLATLTGLRPLLARSAAPRAVAVSSFALVWPPDEELLAALTAGDEERAVRVAEGLAGGSPGGPIYFSTKRALARWVRAQAPGPDWAGASIPLNAVAPGMIATPMTAHTLDDEASRRASEEAIPRPLNGVAEPAVVARLLAWLAGEENSHVCGQVVFVDGGAEALTGTAAY